MPNRIEYSTIFEPIKHELTDKYVLCIDPSGSIKNGVGSTGIVWFNLTKQKVSRATTLKVSNLETRKEMIKKLEKYIGDRNIVHVIVENYVDYGAGAIGTESETKYVVESVVDICQEFFTTYDKPLATQHKNRFTKERLLGYGVNLKHLNRHEQDALKMALYYYMFKYEKERT